MAQWLAKKLKFDKQRYFSGIHIHVGSQGVPLERFVSGTKVLQDFIKDIEAKCGDQIKVVDIGGGLSTSYTEQGEPEGFTFQKYRDQLNIEVMIKNQDQ